MNAKIERSLCIGITKTRFDLYDKVKLKLKNGEIVEGEIIGLGDTIVYIQQEDGDICWIFANDIDGYIA